MKAVVCVTVGLTMFASAAASGFVGHIRAASGPPESPDFLIYTVGTNFMRVEMADTNRAGAIAFNVVNLQTGHVMIVQSGNQTYLRFDPDAQQTEQQRRRRFPRRRPVLPERDDPMTLAGSHKTGRMPDTPDPPDELPPDIGLPASANGTAVELHMAPRQRPVEKMPWQRGPTNVAGMPTVPEMPMPPGGLPPGIGPQISANGPSGEPHTAARGRPIEGTPPAIRPTNVAGMPGMPAMPEMPAPPGGWLRGIGPSENRASSQGATPAMPVMPAMPTMPGMPGMAGMRIGMMPHGEPMELKSAGQETNLLGYTCKRYEIQRRGEVMEIWATDQLPPYQEYLPTQRPRARYGPREIVLEWGRMVASKKLFPLLAVLRIHGDLERYRFEVQSITPSKLTDQEVAGFQPPENYTEVPARPF